MGCGVTGGGFSRSPANVSRCLCRHIPIRNRVGASGNAFWPARSARAVASEPRAAGGFVLILYFGVFLSSLVAGPLIDRDGQQAGAHGLGAAGDGRARRLCPSPVVGAAATCVALLGLGGGGLNIAANVLVSDLYGADRGPMLNALGMFYAIGALGIPLLTASLSTLLRSRVATVRRGAGRTHYYRLLCAALSAARESKGFAMCDLLQVARYPGVALIAALLFFEAGNESSIGGWVSSFAGSLGVDATTATWVLAGFWVAMTVGRLLATWLLEHVGKAQLVLASAAGSVAGCALVFAARSIAGLAAGAALAGLCFAAVFPTTLGIAGDRYPQLSGTVFGLLFSVGLLAECASRGPSGTWGPGSACGRGCCCRWLARHSSARWPPSSAPATPTASGLRARKFLRGCLTALELLDEMIGLPGRFGNPVAVGARKGNFNRAFKIRAVTDRNKDRLHASACAQDGTDGFLNVYQRAPRADLVTRLFVVANEAGFGHSNARFIQHRGKVTSKAEAARVRVAMSIEQ